jgi:WD40 repeat protein
VAVAAAIPFVFRASLAPAGAGLDPAHMSLGEIKALEQRLTDAGCYKGIIDGSASRLLDDAIKACPDQRPFLRVEVGIHTAPIWDVGPDAACRIVATASVDKTIRLWSLPEGKLQRVVRLPIGVDGAAKVAATAVSPNGHFLAVGREDGHDPSDEISSVLYLIEIAKTGEPTLLHRMPFGSRIKKIAFSGDGNRVAVGFAGPQGTGTRTVCRR